MKPVFVLSLALAAATLVSASSVEAQTYYDPYRGPYVTGQRQPDRYLLIQPRQRVRRRTYVRPVVRPVTPPHRVVVVHRQTPPPPVPVEIEVETQPATPVNIVRPRVRRDTPRWFVGVGTGALLRFGDGGTQATPAYRLHVGTAVDQAEFVFRFDLAPGYDLDGEDGADPTDAALYTAGAGFQYRFLPNARLHPVLGFGLETVFLNPQGAETLRAFSVTARAGVEMGVPTNFGEIALGLDVTGHQPIAGAEEAMARLVGVGAHLDFRF